MRSGQLDEAYALAQPCTAPLREHLGSIVFQLGGEGEVDALVDESLLRAMNRIELYDPELGGLHAWLLAIGRNLARDQLARLNAWRSRRTDFDLEAMPCSDAPSREAQRCSDAVWAVLRGLRRAHRQVLLLDLWNGGRAPAAIAREALGVETQTLYNRRGEARAAFSSAWDSYWRNER